MPKLKAVIESLDGLDEPVAGLYTKRESDGKYVLDAEGVEDVSGLKSALEREKAERREARERLKQFEGIDLEEVNQLKAEREKREREKAEQAGNFKALETQLIEKHQKEIEKREGRIKGLSSALERYLVDAQATTAIAAAKGVPELLLPYVKRNLKVVEQENGEFAVQVVDEKGNQRIGDAKGTPMTIPQLVEEIRASPVFARAFEASGQGGSGASANGSGGAATSGKRRRDMSLQDKTAFIAEHGQEAYLALQY